MTVTVHKTQMRDHNKLADENQKPRARAKYCQILDSARVLFLDQGFDATSMDAIAREAGVSKATLYVHFDDKDDLLLALVNDECKRFGPKTLWRNHGGRIDLRKELHAIGTTFLAAFLDPRGLAVVRGGSWDGTPVNSRSALRVRIEPDRQLTFLGFRGCWTVP